jgi:hypothetical protein
VQGKGFQGKIAAKGLENALLKSDLLTAGPLPDGVGQVAARKTRILPNPFVLGGHFPIGPGLNGFGNGWLVFCPGPFQTEKGPDGLFESLEMGCQAFPEVHLESMGPA